MRVNMKGKGILVSVLAVLLVIIFSHPAAMADQTDKLIKILIDKGIITKEEANSLEKAVKGEAPEKEAKEKPSAGESWTDKIEVGYNKGAYIKTTDDRFSTRLRVRTQGRFKYEDEEDQKNTASFDVRRARLLFWRIA